MKVFSILGVLLFCLGCVRLQLGSPVIIDPSRDYLISYEDSVYNYYDGQTKITADLLVDGCGDWRNMCEIKFSDCKLNGDTLDIEIFETNSVVDYHYKIKVWEGRFKIDYWYQTTIDTAIRKIETVKQTLFLDKGTFNKGDIVRGYTEYQGQCTTGCNKAEMQPIHVKGDFKFAVK